MERAISLAQTTVVRKAAMAASGVVIVGYLIGHVAGNLKIYQGPEAINEYAVFLRSLPALLWGTRVLLLAAFAAHIYAAFSLWSRNNEARPVQYKRKKDLVTSYAARTMYWSGPILALFVLYHLAHLTFGVTPYEYAPSNVYNNVVYGFQVPWISAIYIVAQIAVGMHIYHGFWAMFGSLGLTHPKYNKARRGAALVIALGISLLSISIPVSVMAGIVQPTTKQFYYPELG